MSQTTREENRFNIEELLKRCLKKMRHRHPHVFGEKKAKDAAEVLLNWEEIKVKEKRNKRKSVLDGIPRRLPALLRAHRIQDKASRVGFDWNGVEQVFNKLDEEILEFKKAYQNTMRKEIEEELGDILFSLVNVARFLEVNPEDALRKTISKFIERFKYIEKNLKQKGKRLKETSLAEMDSLWEEAKETSK